MIARKGDGITENLQTNRAGDGFSQQRILLRKFLIKVDHLGDSGERELVQRLSVVIEICLCSHLKIESEGNPKRLEYCGICRIKERLGRLTKYQE